MRRSERIATEVLDLLGYPFPVLAERLRFRDNPPPGLPEFSEKVARSDALVIVTPAYHNGYPGALKHALDYLLPEYQRKPITIVTVSAGGFGGRNCLAQLRLVTLGMGDCPIPAALPVSRVQDSVLRAQESDGRFLRKAGTELHCRSALVHRSHRSAESQG